ncbi:MAG: hypothetical protein WBF25_02790 [Terriglobales bacterium]
MLKHFAAKLKAQALGQLQKDSRDTLLLQGRIASWLVRAKESITSLQDVEFKVFSQFGEDGILDWIIERSHIPDHLHSFIEFGVELYEEANTRFLLQNRNWRGLIIDGNSQLETKLRESDLAWRHILKTKSAFVTTENINQIFDECGFSGEIGLLSIDIDGNDYWIWEAIESVNPIITICEYNAVLGDLHPIAIPYNPTFDRSLPDYHNLYCGASIAALQSLAKRKGYAFLGTNSAGNNAFFIRNDYAPRFSRTVIASIAASPSKFRESRDASNNLSFAEGVTRQALISSLPVINIETGDRVTISSLGNLYSDDWLRHARRLVGTQSAIAEGK